jgi:xanthine dehydrogenase YagS FAD-binding subunit
MLPNFEYVRPRSVTEAIQNLGSGSVVLGGGTDLLGCFRDGVMSARNVVSLSGIDEMRGISRLNDGGLRIGALSTLTELATDPIIRESYSALSQGAKAAASPQLRNQGTIGGNLCQRPRCWYFRGDFHCLRKGGDRCYAVDGENEFHCILGGSGCYIVHPSDTAPALVALDAQIRIIGPKGKRLVPTESFFVLPAQDPTKETVLQRGEVVTEILLPSLPHVRSSYRKVRARGAWDFALAGVALALRFSRDQVVDWCRIVLSGVAPTPWRAHTAERNLLGQRLENVIISKTAATCVDRATPLSQNVYKVDLVRGLVEESLLAMA